MRKPTVRVAQDADGPRIGELAEANDLGIAGLDWSRVNPYWLVAEFGNHPSDIVGALNMSLSRPIGWLEMLMVDPVLTTAQKARVFKGLAEFGIMAVHRFGAQMVYFTVPHEFTQYKKLLKRRGCVTVSSGSLMAKRVN